MATTLAPPTDVAVATDQTPASPTPYLFLGLALMAFGFVGWRLSRTGTR